MDLACRAYEPKRVVVPMFARKVQGTRMRADATARVVVHLISHIEMGGRHSWEVVTLRALEDWRLLMSEA